MEVVILASGSKGNASIVKTSNKKILVDIGISFNLFKSKMEELNFNYQTITDILISHEHSDHIKGLKTLTNNLENVTIHLTKGTYDELDSAVKKSKISFNIIKDETEFFIDNIKVQTFKLSHDAKEPVGYVLTHNNKKIVFATDTGYIDRNYYDLLKNGDLYILEANHEPGLLMDSKRPFYLKQRILGDTGHLSNNEASFLINEFIKDKDNTIWAVSHISEDCNDIYSIEKSIVKIVEDPTKLTVIYTSQETSEIIKL